MTKNTLLLLGLALAFVSCNPKQGTSSTSTPEITIEEPPAMDLPREGERTIMRIMMKSSDDKSVSANITFRYKVKSAAPGTTKEYIEKTMDPIVKNCTRQTLSQRNSEDLHENSYEDIRSLLFRCVNENIDPLQVAVDKVTVDKIVMK